MPISLYGQLAVHPHRTQAQSDLIELINDRINPPAPLTLDDVHIRAMRLVSDEVNDHGGRFPREEHERICELLIDSPVMIGHDHSSLPVARNFAARCVDEEERSRVEVWFYWLKGDGPHHDQLAADIDAGVVKEGSIGFEFALPQCSICAQDIRTCEHIPGFDYNGTTVHYEYRNIQRVLETSLVYRGATPGTHIVKYPLFTKLSPLTRPLRGRPLPEGEANKQSLSEVEIGEIDGKRTHLTHSPEQVRSPLPQGEVALRSASEAERVRGPIAPPAHARAFLASFREVRSFYCPAHSDLWSRSVYDFRAGHRSLTSRMRKRVIR